jgi:hypothetical protein
MRVSCWDGAGSCIGIPSLSRNPSLPTLPDVKRHGQLLTSIALPLIAIVSFINSYTKIESIDLKALSVWMKPDSVTLFDSLSHSTK